MGLRNTWVRDSLDSTNVPKQHSCAQLILENSVYEGGGQVKETKYSNLDSKNKKIRFFTKFSFLA
jgi:hypothetical protein